MSAYPHPGGNGRDGGPRTSRSKSARNSKLLPSKPYFTFFDFEHDEGRGTPEERSRWLDLAKRDVSAREKNDLFFALAEKAPIALNLLLNSKIEEVTPICHRNGAPIYLEMRLRLENHEKSFVYLYRAEDTLFVSTYNEALPVVVANWSDLADAGYLIPSGAPELFAALDAAERNGTKISIVFCEGAHAKRGVERLFAHPDNLATVAAYEAKHKTKFVFASWHGGISAAKKVNLTYQAPDGGVCGVDDRAVEYRLPIIAGVYIVRDADKAGIKEADDIRRQLIKKHALPPHKLHMIDPPPGLIETEEGWDDDNPLPPGVTPQQRLAQFLGDPNAEPDDPAKDDPPALGFDSFTDFIFDAHGLRFDDGGKKRYAICGPFKILALCRSAKDKDANWGLLVEITNPDGRKKKVHISHAELHGRGTPVGRLLADAGLTVVPSKMEDLADFLACVKVSARFCTVDSTGWHGDVFVFPDETIGKSDGEQVMLINPGEHGYAQRGTLQEWKDSVGRLASPHRLMRLALATMFAGPLLELLNAESGGLHFKTKSSQGKSTGQGMAASVYGKGALKGGYVTSWNTTINGLEGLAAARSDTGMPIDELSEADPTSVNEMVYMLGNGRGRGRMTREIKLRRSKEFRVSVLSSGEKTPEEIIAERFGRKTTAGVQLRLVVVDADAGAGFGSFDSLDGFENAQAMLEAMKQASVTNYGTAGPAFIRFIVEHREQVIMRVREKMKEFERQFDIRSGQAGRTAHRFAIIAAAGELAIEAGVVPWKAGVVASAAKWAFERWLVEYGGSNVEIEDRNVTQQICREIENYGESRFDDLNNSDESLTYEERQEIAAEAEANREASGDVDAGANLSSSNWKALQKPVFTRYGYRRNNGRDREWWIFPQTWRDVFCRGHDPKKVAQTLRSKGCLIAGGVRNAMAYRRIHGKLTPFFIVTSAIFDLDKDHAA